MRLIDADPFREYISIMRKYSGWNVIKEIDARPTIEITPIIRCKDCKWFNDIGCAIRIVDDTDKPSEEDYCSFAERRTNG